MSNLSRFINGFELSVPFGTTVLQACEMLGIEIPRFCYHERLLVAGNCRMCLVEIVGSPKPQASCALPVSPGMKVLTDTEMVQKARESVMEFLLLNHPLDCPVCDQGGECDLQDQSIVYGSDRSRNHECKRGVEDKYLGPLVKTVMTRCIHCTRCIRFASEIAGVADLGTTSRGNTTEVGTYVEKVLKTEMSGNLVDLCPVGALTSLPTAFQTRPWEQTSVDSIDALDGTGASIRVQTRRGEVSRILPRQNDEINGEWLADKSRYAPIDGLKTNRFLVPVMNDYAIFGKNAGRPRSEDDVMDISLETMFMWWSYWVYKTAIDKGDIIKWQVVLSPTVDIAVMTYFVAMKRYFEMRGLGERFQLSILHGHLPPVVHYRYKDFANRNNPIEDNIEYPLSSARGLGVGVKARKDADVCVLIGVNPRAEAPLINTTRREGFLKGQLDLYTVGNAVSLTMPTEHIAGDMATILADFPQAVLLKRLAAKRPVLMIGASLTARLDCSAVMASLRALVKCIEDNGVVEKDWVILNALHAHSNSMGGAMLGISRHVRWLPYFYPIYIGTSDAELKASGHLTDYVGWHVRMALVTHGDGARLKNSWFTLPLPAATENTDVYLNTEGRLGVTTPARPDSTSNSTLKWDLRAHTPQSLFERRDVEVGNWDPKEGHKTFIEAKYWDQLKGSGETSEMLDLSVKIPDVYTEGLRYASTKVASSTQWAWTGPAGWSCAIATEVIPRVHDYYVEGHPIAQNSPTMAKCSAELLSKGTFE